MQQLINFTPVVMTVTSSNDELETFADNANVCFSNI